MQKKRGIQFFFAILIGWMALFCLPAGYAYASQKEADAPLSMDVSYGFDNTAKSDRYLRVTVLLNNDTAPFEGTLEFLTAQSSLEAYSIPIRYRWQRGRSLNKNIISRWVCGRIRCLYRYRM